MPEGRKLKKKIVDSERLNSVPIEAETLFYKMLTHLDCEGRLKAEPQWVNNKFYSYRNYTTEQVDGWLHDLHNQKKNGLGLIELYEVENRKYLWMPGFEEEQGETWLHNVKPKEAPSTIPAPPTKGAKPLHKEHKVTPSAPIPEFPNVIMSIEEHLKLIEKFGEAGTRDKIEALSLYMQSQGKTYKDHYATVLAWDRRDEKEKQGGTHRGSSRAIRPRESYTQPDE